MIEGLLLVLIAGLVLGFVALWALYAYLSRHDD